MGYLLILIESPIATLLLVATMLALAGRVRWRWLRTVVWFPVTLAVLVMYGALTAGAGFFHFSGTGDRWFYPMLALTLAFLVGAVWLSIRGLCRLDGDPDRLAAAAWPAGKLAIALGVAVALHAMTFWNMDLAARQQLAALRIEAGAAALSATPSRIPDRENAAPIYQQAFEAMGRIGGNNSPASDTWEWEQPWKKAWEEKWSRWDEIGQPGLDTRDPELRRFLARQAAALALFRQAAARPGCYFDRDYGRPTIAMRLPELALLRNGARLLALDAICSAANGDRQRAIEDISAMFGVTGHLRGESLLISMLVAMAVERLAIDSLQAVLTSTQPPAKELPSEWFSGEASYRSSYRRALRTEEALRLATFAQVGEGQFGPAWIASAASGDDYEMQDGRWDVAFAYRIFLLADDLAAHLRFTTDIETISYLPYWQARDRMRVYEETMRSHPGGLMTAILMPALGPVIQRVAMADARRGAARLGLALYRYHAQHGRFPEKLDELVPELIPVVPPDPFDGKPLKLKQSVHGATVYSIGPELDDKHEKPFFDFDKKHRELSFTVPAPTPGKK